MAKGVCCVHPVLKPALLAALSQVGSGAARALEGVPAWMLLGVCFAFLVAVVALAFWPGSGSG